MTTIAYKNNIIAYDSFSTTESHVHDPFCDKRTIVVPKKLVMFLSGDTLDYEKFIEDYQQGFATGPADCTAIIVDQGQLILAGIDWSGNKRKLVANKIDREVSFAIGSGAHYAIGAMDAGATAKRAVEIAAQRDLRTGGRIRTFDIDKYFTQTKTKQEKKKCQVQMR